LHSLAWGVTDSAGRVEGIGSRNFVVLNSGADQLQTSKFKLLTSEQTDTGQRALGELVAAMKAYKSGPRKSEMMKTLVSALSDADISSVGGGSFLGAIQDYNDLRGNRSLSAFDISHRFSAALIYDVPLFSSARGWARTLLGGWQIGSIITEQTGFAAALSSVVDTTGTGIASRPNAVAGQAAMLARDQRTRSRWFNTAAFATANQFTIGSASRNPVRGPSYRDVDLAVMRRVGVGGERALELRFEVFNLLNTANFGAPAAQLGPASFGTITTALDPRVVQLAAKFWF
jgi:hypothetical protein